MATSKSTPRIDGYDDWVAVGRGAMGRVYRAVDQKLQRPVAIKMLVDATDHELARRFDAEAKAIAKLNHPNIARLYEFAATDENLPYCVMEYVGGGTLANLMRGRTFSGAEAASIISTLARAIHYSHLEGILHRDLKPANILLASDSSLSPAPDRSLTDLADPPTVRQDSSSSQLEDPAGPIDGSRLKIVDFGLAKSIVSDDRITTTGQVLGTPAYMSPEQASGTVFKLGPTVDVYALGAILYELLVGRPPIVGNDPVQTMMLLMTEEPVPPKTLQPMVPVDLQTICMKCLEKRPLKRYQTAAELADDLDRFRGGMPVLARPVSLLQRTWKWALRKPWQAASAALALAIFLGTIWVLVSVNAANRRTQAANEVLAVTNTRLEQALSDADQSFKLTERSLRDVIGNLSNQLLKAPEMKGVFLQSTREAADLYHELQRIRPENVEIAKQKYEAVKNLAFSEWLFGDKQKWPEYLVEMNRQLESMRTSGVDERWLQIQELTLLVDQQEIIDSEQHEARNLDLDKQIQPKLSEILNQYPDDPEVLTLAGKYAAGEMNRALAVEDYAAGAEAASKRVDYFRRAWQHQSEASRPAAALLFARSLLVATHLFAAQREWEKTRVLLKEGLAVIDPYRLTDDPDFDLTKGSLLNRLGVVDIVEGDADAAKANLTAALGLIEPVVQVHTDRIVEQLELVEIYFRLAQIAEFESDGASQQQFLSRCEDALNEYTHRGGTESQIEYWNRRIKEAEGK